MNFVNMPSLESRLEQIRQDFERKPFRFVMFEDFFYPEKAQEIHDAYPAIEEGKWDGTTYLDQKNKFQKREFPSGSTLESVFAELNSAEFTNWLERLSGIPEICGDEELFGGGLHQSIAGAFLNVHVDYNIHPTTKFHRRLNVIIYMNKDWRDEYEGHLELWDINEQDKTMLAKVAPTFNRCVIFETNEISFHGHPKVLKTPKGVNRKSIATYYYTPTRPAHEIADEHNTVYVNTEGAGGQAKRFASGVKALLERVNKR